MDLNILLQTDILLAPHCWHDFFLLERTKNPLASFKLMTKEEFLEHAFFKISETSLVYLMQTKNLSYDMAQIYLENLYFLPDAPSMHPQIHQLQNIKNALDQAGLLTKDDIFGHFLKSKKVTVFGYDGHDSELTAALNHVHADFAFVTHPQRITEKSWQVFQFETVEDELQWALNQISLLLSQGVDIDEIFLKDPPAEYRFLLEKMSRFFGIPFNFPAHLTLASSQPGVAFLSDLQNGVSPEIALQNRVSENPDAIESQLLETVQNHWPLALPSNQCHDFFLHCFKNTLLKADVFDHAVTVIEGNFIPPSGYVFVLGFNEGNCPKIHKNVDFLDDSIKRDFHRNDSTFYNRTEERDIIDLLESSCQVFVSYKKLSLSESYMKSPLVDRLSMTIQTDPLSEFDYGQVWSSIRLGEHLDRLRKYHVQHPHLESLRQQLTIPYRTYGHRFSGVNAIDSSHSTEFSYTSLNEFYECQFKYYLDRILGLDPFNENFYTRFGQLAHAVLEARYAEGFDFDTVFEKETLNKDFSKKEKILLQRLKTELANVIAFNDEQEALMESKQVITEKKLAFTLDEGIKVKGIIDKIVLTGPNHDYLSLVDYKTGTVDFNPDLIPFGQSLQLPIYALLASRDPELSSKEVIGLYIQTIISKKLIRPSGKNAQKFYFDQFRLNGVFSDVWEKLGTFDKTYADSKYIKSLKVTSQGSLYASALRKAISPEVLKRYLDETIQQIQKAAKAEKANDFRINPKSINNKELPCRYCGYRDVCFRDETDVVNIQTEENEDADLDE